MHLKVRDIARVMEELAPVKLKESYDNVGLMVGSKDNEVTNILIALDCTMKVIREAIDNNCSLILTHHPILFKKPTSITTDSLLGTKVIELIKNNIDVYSSHTNLDSVSGGINDIIVKMLGYNSSEIIEEHEYSRELNCNCGIGRLVNLEEPITLIELCDKVKKDLKITTLRYSGDEQSKIKRIAVINGSGTSYFGAARALKADCIITGDTTYHYVSDYYEEGVAIIDAGHFATEWPAMKILADIFRSKLDKLGFNNSVIISKEINDPYKYR